MTKLKKISARDLHLTFQPFVSLVTFWFLWDKWQWEWVRTLMVAAAVILAICYIYDIFFTDSIDIFKEGLKG